MTDDATTSEPRLIEDLRSPDRRIRVEALGQLGGSADVLAEVRAIAIDPNDDPMVRVGSVLFLTRHGETVDLEPDAPVGLVSAR